MMKAEKRDSSLSGRIWHLRGLGRSLALRRLAQCWFSFVYRPGRIVQIRRGPLVGCRWQCERGQQFWMPMGVYEKETADWLTSKIRVGSTFVDVGANVGYFTLLGARMVGAQGKVYSFEPVGNSVLGIRRLLSLNRFENTIVEQAAVGDRAAERVSFVVERQGANSHLGDVKLAHATSRKLGNIEIPMVSLDIYFSDKAITPDVIKVDVEGAETLVLRGMAGLLVRSRPTMIVSTHSAALRDECWRILSSAGYLARTLPGFDHEIVAEHARE